MINSLTALKRHCTNGTQLTMVQHDWYPEAKLLNVARYVVAVQGNAIALSPDPDATEGSWLYWPEAAKFNFTKTGFSVALNDDDTPPRMHYRYEQDIIE